MLVWFTYSAQRKAIVIVMLFTNIDNSDTEEEHHLLLTLQVLFE